MVLPGALIFVYRVTTNIAYCQRWLTRPERLPLVKSCILHCRRATRSASCIPGEGHSGI